MPEERKSLPKRTTNTGSVSRTLMRKATASIGGMMSGLITRVSTKTNPLERFVRLDNAKIAIRSESVNIRIDDNIKLSYDLAVEQNQLLSQIVKEIKDMDTDDGSLPDLDLDRVRKGGQRGRYGSAGRARLDRKNAARRTATAERLGKRAAEVVKGARNTLSTARAKVANRVGGATVTPSRPTITPPMTATTPAPSSSRVPATSEPPTERVETRTVAGRTVTVNSTRFNQTVSAVRLLGAVGTAISIMDTVTEVRELYALREMNKQNSAEGITEEEFYRGLVELTGSIMGGFGGATIGAQLGGVLGLSAGPYGSLFGAIAGGFAGGMLGSTAGEVIGTAIFDQITGSNRLTSLDQERIQRIVDESRRLGAGGPAVQTARQRRDLIDILQRMVNNNELSREQANSINRRVTDGTITFIQAREEAAMLAARRQVNPPTLNESQSRSMNEFLRTRNVTPESTENYEEIRNSLSNFIIGNGYSIDNPATQMRMESRLSRMRPASSEREPVARSTTGEASPTGATRDQSQPATPAPTGRSERSFLFTPFTNALASMGIGGSTPAGSSATPVDTPSAMATATGAQSQPTGDFMSEVNRVSEKFGLNPANMLALMRSESSLNPQAVNASTGATGLIQFMPATARSLGTTTEALRGMSAAQQMQYVEKYFDSVRLPQGASAGQLYAYVFLPGRARREVLTAAGENFYEANRGLDMDSDGRITISDLDMRMARYGGTLASSSASMAAADQAQLMRTGQSSSPTVATTTNPSVGGRSSTTPRTGEVPLNRRLQKQVA